MNINQVVARVAGDRPVRRSGGGYMVSCPVHGAGGGDSNPSLEISPGTSQPIVFRCHAGCETEDILAAVGLTWDEISAERAEGETATSREWMPNGLTHQETYDYMDADGNLIWQVLRSTNKQFLQRHPDPSGPRGWRWTAPPMERRVLYRLPKVLEAVAGGVEVWMVEGERDVHAMEKAGLVATTSPGGAKAWHPHYAEHLRGARVTIVADRDEVGRAHARAVRASLLDVECQARIVEAAAGKDARDHLEAGNGPEAFLETVPYEEEPTFDLAPSLGEYLGENPGERVMVIDGLLAEREVCIVTGYEGHGKSSFMKQVCIQASFGIHPFSLRQIAPVRCLFVDLENPKMDNFEDFQRLAQIAGYHSEVSGMDNLHIVESRPTNLATDEGAAWLIERVHAHRPQLVTIGPLYNMMGEDASAEAAVRPVKDVLDYIREKYGCAILIEHHVPHRSGDVRDVRPIGSSILMRWPAFGFGLAPINEPLQPGEHKPKPTGVYEWSAWRGPRRRGRIWPTHLRWGTPDSAEWMWMEAEPDVIADAMSRAKGAKA